MRFSFVPFGARAPGGAVACDGLVPGARLDLSHWSGNRTPPHLKADTSVEIALRFVRERGAHDVEVVTNNHFDADGVLAVWTALRPELALAHESVIVAAAEHGDFDEWPADHRGVWLEAAVSALGGDRSDTAAYEEVLGALDTLVPDLDTREDLWGEAWRRLLAAETLLTGGQVGIEREGRVAVVTHAAGVAELPGAWLARRRPEGTDRVLLAFAAPGGGFTYRYELPRWAWADTVRRPAIAAPRRGVIRRTLGEGWIVKGRRGMTGLAYCPVAVPLTPLAAARVLSEIS